MVLPPLAWGQYGSFPETPESSHNLPCITGLLRSSSSQQPTTLRSPIVILRHVSQLPVTPSSDCSGDSHLNKRNFSPDNLYGNRGEAERSDVTSPCLARATEAPMYRSETLELFLNLLTNKTPSEVTSTDQPDTPDQPKIHLPPRSPLEPALQTGDCVRQEFLDYVHYGEIYGPTSLWRAQNMLPVNEFEKNLLASLHDRFARDTESPSNAMASKWDSVNMGSSDRTRDDESAPRKKAHLNKYFAPDEDYTPIVTNQQTLESAAADGVAAAAAIACGDGPTSYQGLRRSGRHRRPSPKASTSATSASNKRPTIQLKRPVVNKGKATKPVREPVHQPEQDSPKAYRPLERVPRPSESLRSTTIRRRGRPTIAESVGVPKIPLRRRTRQNHTPYLHSPSHRERSIFDNDDDTEEQGGSPTAHDQTITNNETSPPSPSQHSRHSNTSIPETPLRQRRTSSSHGHGIGFGRLRGHVTDNDVAQTRYAESLLLSMGGEPRLRSQPSLLIEAIPLISPPELPPRRGGVGGVSVVPSHVASSGMLGIVRERGFEGVGEDRVRIDDVASASAGAGATASTMYTYLAEKETTR